LGPNWRDGTTEEGAYDVFFEALGASKRYKAMYRLRKVDQLRFAYGLFGLSDHADGLWLLSNAVAKDYSILEDYDHRKLKDGNLFADLDRESRQKASFERLVAISEQAIRLNPKLRGADLAAFLFNQGIGTEELFGNYEERDYTTAVYHVLGLPDRRSNAKTKRD